MWNYQRRLGIAITIVTTLMVSACIVKEDIENTESTNAENTVDSLDETTQLYDYVEQDDYEVSYGDSGDVFTDSNDVMACTNDYSPVCAEGVTYDNVCLAIEDGDKEYTEGACEGQIDDPIFKEVHRNLLMSTDSVEVDRVDQYFSMNIYGWTQHFYHFVDDNAVLRVIIKDDSLHTSVAKVILFEENATPDDLEIWINNQVSDAIFLYEPTPTFEYQLTENEFSVTRLRYIDSATGWNGDEWDNYSVSIQVNEVLQGGQFFLEAFEDSATAHVWTNK